MTATLPSTGGRESARGSLPGFAYDDATGFIEFCIELDDQDDGLENPADDRVRARIDGNLWALVDDSRQAVAEDYVEFTRSTPSARSTDPGWGLPAAPRRAAPRVATALPARSTLRDP